MKIKAVDPEEEYQELCREYERNCCKNRIGELAWLLCDRYIRLLLGFADLYERTEETQCFCSLPYDLVSLTDYVLKTGVHLSCLCFDGIRFLDKNFQRGRTCNCAANLSKAEAALCIGAVDEIREKVLAALPRDWREPRDL